MVDLCTEADGTIAVYLTDTTCSAQAANYLTSKCGVGYSNTTCLVDCNSIYSWTGSYWKAQGCNTLGNPCGAQGECSASVSNVCQAAASATPSPSAPSSSLNGGQISGVVVGIFFGLCALIGLFCYCGGSGGGGGGGGTTTTSGSAPYSLTNPPPRGDPLWRTPEYQTPAWKGTGYGPRD